MLAAAAQLATAGVINFDDLGLANFDPISATYADPGAGGNGDARVGVQYGGSGGAGNHLLFWNDLYGSLLKVALTPTDGTMAQITLTADPGWLIKSITFTVVRDASVPVPGTLALAGLAMLPLALGRRRRATPGV